MSDNKIMIEQETDMVGKLLMAMPGMGDARFHRAVIIICAYDEDGAMGLVINQKMPKLVFKDLIKQLDINIDPAYKNVELSIPVIQGGPVEGARGFLLHRPEFHQPDTIHVNNNFGVTGTLDAIKEVAEGRGPEDLLFILGYSGWSAGQLDLEIQQNAWLVVDSDPDIVFHKDLDKKWDKAIHKLGVDPAMLSGVAGRA